MGYKTGISWCDSSHNFFYGCRKVSEGCKFCYAERDMKRFGRDFGRITRAQDFYKPLSWKEPRKIFINSWSDFFIEEGDQWRDDAWGVMRDSIHTFQVLTKRPERMKDHMPKDWGDGWPSVWLGVTVENQKNIGRIGYLAEIPCRVKFVSYEPVLGIVDFTRYLPFINWMIIGGESGMKARPMDLSWALDVVNQCREAGVAVWFKQVGGHTRIDGVWGGDKLLGKIYHEFPKV